jgi:hypothetical protein
MSFLDATGMGQRPPCGICSVRSLNDLLRSISCYPARTRSSVQHSSVVLTRYRNRRGVAHLSRMHGARVRRMTSHTIGLSRVGPDPQSAARAVEEAWT